MPTRISISVWRTIKLGTHKNVDSLQTALKNADCQVDDEASKLLNSSGFTLSATETEVELVRIPIKDLGITKGARLLEIYERANKNGLDPCPAEVGPQVCLQCDDPFINADVLVVAMKPIIVRCHHEILAMYTGGIRDSDRISLGTELGHSDSVLPDWFEILFVLRR